MRTKQTRAKGGLPSIPSGRTRLGLRLTWLEDASGACLQVTGWTHAELDELALPGGTERLAVFPAELAAAGLGAETSLQPMAGEFRIDQNAVVFRPTYPFL